MSDKIYLKEITLPIVETGEDETYSFVQTDDDLETAGDAADAKAVGDELTNLKQDYSQLLNTAYVTETIMDSAVASFSDGADGVPVKSLTVGIEPVQSGTGDSSPSNVRPISGWTGCIIGKSDIAPIVVDEVVQGTIQNTTGEGTNNTRRIRTDFIAVKPSTKYRIFCNFPFVGFFMYASANTASYIQREYVFETDAVFTTTSTTNYVRLLMGKTESQNTGETTSTSDFLYCLVCEGENSSSISVDWTTEAGTVYGGTLDVTSGVLTVDHVKKELTGAETSWSQYDASSPHNYYMVSLGYNRNTCVAGSGICTHFPAATINSSNDSLGFHCADSSSLNKFGAFFRWDMSGDFDTLEKFKTYVAGQYSNNTPVEVCFKVKSGETYQLTPTEVATLLGQNNIWSDTGNTDVEYRADTKLYVDGKVSTAQNLMELLITANRENSMTASQAYSEGDLVIINGTLYEVASSIANGSTFTPGTNVIATTVAAELAALA